MTRWRGSLPLRGRLLRLDVLRELALSRLAVPLLERLRRDLPLHQQLRELSALRLALERHITFGSERCEFHDSVPVACRDTRAELLLDQRVRQLRPARAVG